MKFRPLAFSLFAIYLAHTAAQSNDQSPFSETVLSSGILPAELLAGRSLEKLFPVNDALKGIQSLLGSQSEEDDSRQNVDVVPFPRFSPNEIPEISKMVDDGHKPEPKLSPIPIQIHMIRPFRFPSLGSLFRQLPDRTDNHRALSTFAFNSPSQDFVPISRPLRSIHSFAQGMPLFSRSVMITSDGKQTVRHETRQDEEGNVITTTTTYPQKSDEENKSPEKALSSQSENPEPLIDDGDIRGIVNSVLSDMPEELKDILGLSSLSEHFGTDFRPSDRSSAQQVESSIHHRVRETDDDNTELDLAADEDDDKDEDDKDDDEKEEEDDKAEEDGNDGDDDLYDEDDDKDDKLITENDPVSDDDESAADVSGSEKRKEAKQMTLEFENQGLDATTQLAVVKAVADKLKVSPSQLEVVEVQPAQSIESVTGAEVKEAVKEVKEVEEEVKEAATEVKEAATEAKEAATEAKEAAAEAKVNDVSDPDPDDDDDNDDDDDDVKESNQPTAEPTASRRVDKVAALARLQMLGPVQ